MIVALYARVSTTKQAEKDLFIPDQLKQMRDWCAARQYIVAMEYIESGASATDDPSGEMARRIFSLFDEYQSKENSKHTLRAMKKNARQGYFNGSRTPYGFTAVQLDSKGNKRKKKRLEVDPDEAAIAIHNLASRASVPT